MKKSGYDREVGESGMPDRPPSVAELVFDNNPDLCAVYGIDGKIIDFNPSFAKAFLNFSDIEGRPPQPEEYNFFTFVDKEYLDILKELLNKLKPGEKLTQVVPKNIINEESGTGLRVIQWVTVTDGNGTYFTYGHDVTDDIRSEERKTLLSMRRVEDILHRRIDNLPIGYIEIKLLREDLTIEEQDIVVQAIDRLIELKLTQDPSYQDSLVQTERLLDPYLDVSMLYQNGMAERILGLTTQSREPNEVFDLQLTDGTSLAQYILDLLATSSSEALLKPLATRDYKYSDTDGELVVIQMLGKVNDNRPPYTVDLVVLDTTEQHLASQREQKIEISKGIAAFMRIMEHHMRNMLGPITTYGSILEDIDIKDLKLVKKYGGIIAERTWSIVNLLNLLDLYSGPEISRDSRASIRDVIAYQPDAIVKFIYQDQDPDIFDYTEGCKESVTMITCQRCDTGQYEIIGNKKLITEIFSLIRGYAQEKTTGSADLSQMEVVVDHSLSHDGVPYINLEMIFLGLKISETDLEDPFSIYRPGLNEGGQHHLNLIVADAIVVRRHRGMIDVKNTVKGLTFSINLPAAVKPL